MDGPMSYMFAVFVIQVLYATAYQCSTKNTSDITQRYIYLSIMRVSTRPMKLTGSWGSVT